MFGLHGLERRDERTVDLVDHEQARLDRLAALAADAAALAGDGAWVEWKPAGVVLARAGGPPGGGRQVGR